MAQISPKIRFYDKDKIDKINPETIKLWNKYKIDMSIRELSATTIDGYYNDLLHFWLYSYDNFGNMSALDITEDEITEFLYFCKTQGNNSRRIKRRISSIAAFYKFLRKKRLINENPMEYIERPKKDTDIIVQTFLTKEQVQNMREILQSKYDSEKTTSSKHFALMLLCYAMFSLSTMARVKAVSNTKWEQIDFNDRTVNDVLEKEGKIVTLYFSEYVKNLLLMLQKYRIDNNINDNGFVFVAKDNDVYNSVSAGTLNQWCKKIGKLINVETLHCHDFRHSGSNLMKLAGAEIQDISVLLNHSGTDVTVKHYLKIDKNKVRENRDKYGI